MGLLYRARYDTKGIPASNARTFSHGWYTRPGWMVDGKVRSWDDRRGDSKEIRVRPIRLASHLSMAVATYGALCWNAWDVFELPNKNTAEKQVAQVSKDALRQASQIRTGSIHLTALAAVTIVSGALVAGNDAGRAFNTFPLMDEKWIPDDILELTPWQRNLTENTATVQWNHRVLGVSTAAAALGLAGLGLGRRAAITPQVRRGLYAAGAAATGQATLGIVTLLNYVPISLAAAHQLGSVVVFTSGLYLVHSLRYARPTFARSVRQLAK
mmetsp:Transcript_10199/g.18554  ORF Transcript_10199/g.18554 Transcript_10199/m.18554 type:complete len:270 (+) Transcript_10199:447-1256(+)